MADEGFLEFIDSRRQLSERMIARLAAEGRTPTYKMRLRVRFGSKLNADVKEMKLKFKGRRLLLRPRNQDASLNSDHWVVFSATRFSTIEAAAEYGRDLQKALSVICALRGMPVDVGGENRPTTQFSDRVKEAVAEKTGAWLIEDVHGLDVYPETVTSQVMTSSAKFVISFGIEPYIIAMDKTIPQIRKLNEMSELSCDLLNASAMSNHPVAAATLSLSAVELLAVNEKRSPQQKAWIKQVRDKLDADLDVEEDDKVVLRKAVEGMFNAGISDRVKKMLTRLGMAERHGDWDRIYKLRSALFHGVRRVSQGEIVDLGSEAPALSRAIIRRYLEDQVGVLPE